MIRNVFAGAAALLVLGSDLTQPDPLAARAKGRADAPVTVYEMSDFQCPYCREFAMSTMPVLERQYIEPGKVRFVYINLPRVCTGTPHPRRRSLCARLGSSGF